VQSLFYIRLISLTAGTLVYLFLLALILGHRRPRFFERILFFVCLCLFLMYSGGLLEMNAVMEYGSPPQATQAFYTVLYGLGTAFLPAALLHAHLLYVRSIQGRAIPRWGWLFVWLFYLAPFVNFLAVAFIVRELPLESSPIKFGWFSAGARFLLLPSVGASALFDFFIARFSRDTNERRFFVRLGMLMAFIFGALALPVGFANLQTMAGEVNTTALIMLSFLPGVLLLYYAVGRNFLDYGAQRNLVYALPVTLLALLYLALVRRVGTWLEPVIPPEATASVLLFALIFLFEPLERVIGPILQRRFQERMGAVQRLMTDLQQEARQGIVGHLISEAERRIREAFGLAAVRISVPRDSSTKPLASPGGLGHVLNFPVKKDGAEIGLLEAASTGSFLTGETSASLQVVADQLPAMIDLSRLIEEKVRLERELAERERLASLGQMAASVSHNLRNPLSSMKTVLQVQLENPGLPVDIRRDCALVVTEIDRMNTKLTQLLRYAKPSVSGERVAAVTLAKQTAVLFRHDAERRNVRLEFEQPSQEVFALASEDSLSEVLSNLIVNAIEAQPNGGRVRVSLARHGGRLEIVVEDDGPGISQELRAKIFQPYFTTKPSGTGLGLSIVARRVDEMGGTLACESPLRNGNGARFRLSLPVAPDGPDGSGAASAPNEREAQ
jgi:signal transduction histidine kinase